MNFIVFPGQGSQVVGMGKDFFEKHEIVKKLLLCVACGIPYLD